ncbi:AraC family transcriptional regulator [Caulobacter segnis]|uniref:helix-turn-helix domain-containing protein n=1 Tax=Caulobacter segnis TaxID=88688 RepID=UPI002410459F|nr:AraC family transcriptional regulator [Caulobacter segnis]MDG2520461.1 AraC family transcriptional regulator [Caulobacter segnis]
MLNTAHDHTRLAHDRRHPAERSFAPRTAMSPRVAAPRTAAAIVRTRRSMLRVELTTTTAKGLTTAVGAARRIVFAGFGDDGTDPRFCVLGPGQSPEGRSDAPFEALIISMDDKAVEDIVQAGGVSLAASLGGDCSWREQDAVLAGLAPLIRGCVRRDSQSILAFDQIMAAAVLQVAQLHGAAVPTDLRPGGLAPWQERKARDLIRASLAKEVTVDDVARACNLCVTYFSKAFKVSTGMTPHQWLQACRVETARGLLEESDTPLAQIAVACGFADQSHFTKIFKRECGLVPSAWRRVHRSRAAAPRLWTGELSVVD